LFRSRKGASSQDINLIRLLKWLSGLFSSRKIGFYSSNGIGNRTRGNGLFQLDRLRLRETLQQAAEREILEETGLRVKAKDPIYTFDLMDRNHENRIRFHYVIIDLMADLIGGELRSSDDAVDAKWFTPEEVEKSEVTERTREFLRKIRFIR